MTQLVKTVGRVRRHINPSLRIEGVLLTLVDARTNLARQVERSTPERHRRTQRPLPWCPGRGVVAEVGGRTVYAGSAALLAEHGLAIPDALGRRVDATRAEGATITYLGWGDTAAGFIALADRVRENATAMLSAVWETGVEPVLLTGDHEAAAAHVAAELGITTYKAACLPEDKLSFIDDSERAGKGVCMVGDGVNDAPALKRALVGIAMGGVGSDIAVDAADIALVNDDIAELPHLPAPLPPHDDDHQDQPHVLDDAQLHRDRARHLGRPEPRGGRPRAQRGLGARYRQLRASTGMEAARSVRLLGAVFGLAASLMIDAYEASL